MDDSLDFLDLVMREEVENVLKESDNLSVEVDIAGETHGFDQLMLVGTILAQTIAQRESQG